MTRRRWAEPPQTHPELQERPLRNPNHSYGSPAPAKVAPARIQTSGFERQSERPFIFDETLDSPDTVALYTEDAYEGSSLLARRNSPDSLSMSGYGKASQSQLHEFESSRTFAEPSFAYAAPPFASQPAVTPTTGNTPNYSTNSHLSHVASYDQNGRSQYDDHGSVGLYSDNPQADLNGGSAQGVHTPRIEVTSYTPSIGTKGTKLYVYFRDFNSVYGADFSLLSTSTFSLVFGTRKCLATPTRMDGNSDVMLMSVEVPAFELTGCFAPQVPLYMMMEGDSEEAQRIDVGMFAFTDEGLVGAAKGQQEVSRKRKSSDSLDSLRSPKQYSNTQIRPKEEFVSVPYGYTQQDAYYHPLQQSSSYQMMPQFSRGSGNFDQQPRSIYQYQPTTSPPLQRVQSPQVAGWNYPLESKYRTTPTARGSGSSTRPTLSSLPSPLTVTPALVRTTVLQAGISPVVTPGTQSHSIHDYSLSAKKALLRIIGNLDDMAYTPSYEQRRHHPSATAIPWTAQEMESQRRIVLFKRAQAGSTITTSFRPVPIDERPQNAICISCIWWESEGECYITSVDMIYLLESLVAAKFTIDEKNRIRRNLEGSKPRTVSKGKADTDAFFKMVMAFPNPKPRNIEKDIKVFPWRCLSGSLHKIFGKYSASPAASLPYSASPSQPALLTPVSSSSFVGTEAHNGDHLSPRSISRSISNSSLPNAQYASAPSSRPMSPPHFKNGTMLHSNYYSTPVTNGGYQDQQNQGHQSYQQQMPSLPIHPVYTPQALQNASQPTPRQSWDMSNNSNIHHPNNHHNNLPTSYREMALNGQLSPSPALTDREINAGPRNGSNSSPRYSHGHPLVVGYENVPPKDDSNMRKHEESNGHRAAPESAGQQVHEVVGA